MRTLLISLLFALLPVPLDAQDPDDRRTITVHATAVVEREPDQAVVRLAVDTMAATAEQAAARNAETVDSVLSALRRLGIDDDRIRTVGYRVRPEYDRSRERRREVTGYRARNEVQVTVVDLEAVGRVIDAAIAAGANRVRDLRLGLDDPAAARRAALREAVARARDEARTIADAAGARLGPLLRASTGRGRPAEPRPRVRTEAVSYSTEADVSTPVEPGTIRVSADVTAVYALEQ